MHTFKECIYLHSKTVRKESKELMNTRFRVRVTLAGEARVMEWNRMRAE